MVLIRLLIIWESGGKWKDAGSVQILQDGEG